MSEIRLGIIGGSGLYGMSELTDIEERVIETPFGKPSDAVMIGTLHGQRVAFIARHGRGHKLTPTEVPYQANVYALKLLGVRHVIAVSACGSLREDYAPGHIVIPNQLYDNTKHRDSTFFKDGMVAHVSVADPFSPELSDILLAAVKTAGGTVHHGGTFITIEGPRFSTRGESNTFRNWGMSIIGMTTSPEAFLCAEAEMAYACMAHVTDYDVWHQSEEPVTVEMVIRTLMGNTAIAQKALSELARTIDSWDGEFAAHAAMKDAILADKSQISPEIQAKYALLAGKYL